MFTPQMHIGHRHTILHTPVPWVNPIDNMEAGSVHISNPIFYCACIPNSGYLRTNAGSPALLKFSHRETKRPEEELCPGKMQGLSWRRLQYRFLPFGDHKAHFQHVCYPSCQIHVSAWNIQTCTSACKTARVAWKLGYQSGVHSCSCTCQVAKYAMYSINLCSGTLFQIEVLEACSLCLL